MLQQILRDMHIDPDLLAELDEEQKQMLFCKMREEQIRRWKEREEQLEREEKKSAKPKKTGGRQVGFTSGPDGLPWTWVMGDHPKDKSIDQMLEDEAQRQARNLAEHEAEATIRKFQDQEELAKKLESHGFSENDTKKVVEQLWKQNISSGPVGDLKNLSLSSQPGSKGPTKTGYTKQQQQPAEETKAPLRVKVNSNMMASINSVKEKRSSEIFASLQFQRQQSIDEAEQQGQTINSQWLEQEKKSKQEEEKQRLIAKKAREDHRRTMRKLKTESQIIGSFTIGLRFAAVEKPTPGVRPTKGRPPRPSNKEEVMKWFRETEVPKGSGLDPRTKQLADYFHGMISREHAESMLRSRPTGSYVIRLSDKVWGYGLSYKGEGSNIKHYLIDATDVGYQFFGTNQIVHKSLADFVKHYQTSSMCLVENELLQYPCPHGKQQRKDCEALVTIDNPGGGEVSYL